MLVGQLSKILLLVACAACASVPLSAPKLDGRIVGGTAINITQAPWQVSLQGWGSHFCGGSIISENWIVTAAHCTYGRTADSIQIRAGSSSHFKNGHLLKVKRIVQHKKFNRKTIDYDFSLLELEEPLEFDETKQPITLHNFDENFADNKTCVITGWGSTQNSSESNQQLRGAEVSIVDHQKCVKAYSSFVEVTPRMICAGSDGKDSCQGDSGGPLIAFNAADGKPRLVGIVSWGKGCALPGFPGVYSRVLAARDWFLTHTDI